MKRVAQTSHRHSLRRLTAAGIGTIVLGAIGSGVWDVVAKPGLSRFALGLLNLITFGSTTIRDLPYSSAAIDPEPVPQLLLLFAVSAAMLLAFSDFIMSIFLRPLIRRSIQARADSIRGQADSPDEAKEAVARWARKRRYLAVALLTVLVPPIVGFAFTTFSVVNQAVAVRRIFDANCEILAPYISVDQHLRLRSEFARMTTKAQWSELVARMQQMSQTAGVELRPELVR